MKPVFKNPNDKRLRAGWRILLFIVIFWPLSAIILVIKPLFGEITKREYVEDFSIVIVLILAIATTIAVRIARRYLDKKSFQSLGLTLNRQGWKDLFFGFALSGLMAGLFFLTMVTFGWIELTGFSFSVDTPVPFSIADVGQYMSVMSTGVLFIIFIECVLVGYWEELAFRGYLFQNMRDGMGLKLAIMSSCLIYGLIHATNPNATILSSAIIVFFGFLRLYGYLSTKMLWLSMGMHIGWNFFQGPIFGFAASGHQKATIIQVTHAGPNWLTGGEFGPEGSVVILPILFLALWIMRWWSQSDNLSLAEAGAK
jgi:membrane protease YdiL (CAAX protease family)